MLSLAQLFSPRRVVARRDDSARGITARLVRDLQEARTRLEGQHSADDFLQRSRRTLLLAEAEADADAQPRLAQMPQGPLVEALEIIFAGSAADGRWLNGLNQPCGDHDPQARWVAYEPHEQSAWLEHVAHLARHALTQVDGYLTGSKATPADA